MTDERREPMPLPMRQVNEHRGQHAKDSREFDAVLDEARNRYTEESLGFLTDAIRARPRG